MSLAPLRLAGLALLVVCSCQTPEPISRLPGPCAGAFSIYDQAERGSFAVVARNSCHVPVLVELAIPEIHNLRPSQELPARFSVPVGATQRLMTLDVIDSRNGSSYRAASAVIFGETLPAADPSFRYAFPFGGDEPRRLIQGVDGGITHEGPTRYAFDFGMPVGTPVVAARGGTVLQVVDGFPEGGFDPKFANRVNIVSVLHDDGTIGAYGHFSAGIAVREGQIVAAGEFLGSSGNSGYSQGPHVHFQVNAQRFVPAVSSAESIPILFRGDLVPVEGQEYGPYLGPEAGAAR